MVIHYVLINIVAHTYTHIYSELSDWALQDATKNKKEAAWRERWEKKSLKISFHKFDDDEKDSFLAFFTCAIFSSLL